MKTIKFRDLRANEIDLRVGSTKKDKDGNPVGFQLLLYKDARVDANILDETVGAFNWQKKFYQVKNTMICSLGINMNYDDPSKEPYWVWKDDAGDESETEAIKGEASDAFKRASFAFGGLGRALYTAPFIWVKVDEDNNPKTSHYQVKEISYENNEISKLVIVNEKTGQVIFSKGSTTKVSQTAQKSGQNEIKENDPIREEDKTLILDYAGTLGQEDYDSFFNWMLTKFKTRSVSSLTASQGIILANIVKGRKK